MPLFFSFLPERWLILVLFLGKLVVDAQISVSLPHLQQLQELEPIQRYIIKVPVAAFILDSEDEDDDLSSERTVDTVHEHFAMVNETWYTQACIEIDTLTIERVTVPRNLLEGLIWQRGVGRDFRSFFQAVNRGDIAMSSDRGDALIWAFYVRTLGGLNGVKPMGTNSFFVVDDPTVHDYRVTSHEIGHILRLHHDAHDPDMLMFSGSNGMTLTPVEQTVSRYAADGMMRFFDSASSRNGEER